MEHLLSNEAHHLNSNQIELNLSLKSCCREREKMTCHTCCNLGFCLIQLVDKALDLIFNQLQLR